MTNQTKNNNVLNSLKTIHNLHTSGDIISLLRGIRENKSQIDYFSNNLNAKLKEINAKKETELAEQTRKSELLQAQEKAKETAKTVEKEPKQEPKIEVQSEPAQKSDSLKPNFNSQNPKQNFDQKRTFNTNGQPRPNFNNERQQGARPFNQGQRQYNQNQGTYTPGQRPPYNNQQRPFGGNQQGRPFGNQGTYTPGQRPPFNQGQRPPFNQGQRPFGNNQSSFGFNRNQTQFSSTKVNNFKNFAPAEKSTLIVQQERNYANKNKSSVRQLDEKRQINKKLLQRRGFLNLDADNEERASFRKLIKPKKKSEVFIAPSVTNAIISTEIVTVKTLSEKIGKPVPDIIKKLMLLGIMATINSALDFTTAELVANELGIELEQKIDKSYEEKLLDVSKETAQDKDAVKRPAVVTVMGHVDHGKTSLLDAIRKTNIASGEAGGITQKIGAYSIVVNNEKITFIDTPGHAAFTSMRARGAKITDIAVLVVAADDGIMPQTIEAINHIKSANVPIVVAVNKMDTPEANIDRVKSQLAENGVLPEDWGGDTIIVPVSAKTGVGISELINMILLVADMQGLKANPNKMATGTVIEAELDKNRGPIATVLVQSGTLKVGDSIMSGITFGKIRAMFNENGKQIKEATPSTPVSVLGFYEVPYSGDQVFVVSEKISKQVISERKTKIKEEQSQETAQVTIDNFMDRVNENKLKTFNIIIKADVQGSVEALKQSLTAITNEEVKVVCIHSGVGNVTESDLVLAKASGALIVNFNLKVLSKIQSMADSMAVQVKQYSIIYEVVDEITDAINGMLTVKYEQVVRGHAEVRMVFKLSSNGLIAGSYVIDGKILRNAMARLIRNKEIIADTDIVALKIVKDDKAEVGYGFECGIKLKDVESIKEGDIIECYENVPIKR